MWHQCGNLIENVAFGKETWHFLRLTTSISAFNPRIVSDIGQFWSRLWPSCSKQVCSESCDLHSLDEQRRMEVQPS